jgi:hypothetical protein
VVRADELKMIISAIHSVEGWQLSRTLQGRLRKDGVIVELTADKGSIERYSPDSNKVSVGKLKNFHR